MLLQSHEGLLRLFPTVPPGHAATFRLRAVDGFIVSAKLSVKGVISDVSISAPSAVTAAGSKVAFPQYCRLLNPWGDADVSVNGDMFRPSKDEVVRFPVEPGKL